MHADCIIVCVGGRFSGTFQNCQFHRTPLYVVHGARVILNGCSMDDAPQGTKVAIMLPLLILSGDGTLATLTDCHIGFCRTALVIDHGAALEASDCDVRDTGVSLLMCGVGASAAVDSCSFRGAKLGPTLRGYGAVVRRGGLFLERCTFDAFHTATFGGGAGTRIDMREVRSQNCIHALMLERHAVGATRDCVFNVRRSEGVTRPVVGVALGAYTGTVARAFLQMERTHVQVAGRCTLEISPGGGAVAARLCRLEGPAQALVSAMSHTGGTMSLDYCAASGGDMCVAACGHGDIVSVRMHGGRYEGRFGLCLAKGNAAVSAAGVEFVGVHERQPLMEFEHPMDRGLFEVSSGARGWLHQCRFHNGNIAMVARNAVLSAVDVRVTGMLATASGRTLVANRAPGPDAYKSAGYMCLGSQVKVQGGVIDQCIYGVVATDSSTAPPVSPERLVVRDCVVGVQASKECELAISGCEFRGPRRERSTDPPVDLRNPTMVYDQGAAIHTEGASSGTFTNCVFEGFLSGLLSGSTGNFAIQGCDFTVGGDGGCGVFVKSGVSIEDSRFVGSPMEAAGSARTQGVHCSGGKCELRRCSFDGLQGEAIAASPHDVDVTMTVIDTKVAVCGTGLSVRMRATVRVQDLEVDGTRQGITMDGGDVSAKRLTVRGANEAVHAGCRAGPATLKLVDPTLRESQVGLRAAGHQTKLTVVRGIVQKTNSAAEFDSGANCRMKETRFVGCKNGVQVGDALDPDLVRERKCPICGLAGQAAEDAALRTLCESGGRGVAGARCAHAGAVSRVSMADVRVDCAEAAVQVQPHGNVDATGVVATKCGIGFVERYISVRSRFVECKAVDCVMPSFLCRLTDALKPMIPLEEVLVVDTSERNGTTGDC